jgi:hypothetical protein
LIVFFENPTTTYSTKVGNSGALNEARHHGIRYNHNTIFSYGIEAQEYPLMLKVVVVVVTFGGICNSSSL